MLNKLMTILSGVMMGIIMAMILILLTRMNGYQLGNLPFMVILVIAGVFPLCTTLFERYDYPITTIRLMMIATSFLIFLIYINQIAKDEGTYNTLLLVAVCYHGVGLLVTSISHLYSKK